MRAQQRRTQPHPRDPARTQPASPMDALPPNQGGASGSGGSPPGKDQQQASGSAQQQVLDLFGVDLGTATFTLVLLLLGIMRASMTRCECL